MFSEMWPIVQANISDRSHRVDFTARLLRTFIHDDMDAHDVVDIHPEVAEAVKLAGSPMARWRRFLGQFRRDLSP